MKLTESPRAFTMLIPALCAIFVSTQASQAGTISSDATPTVTISVDGFNGPSWEYSPALEVLESLPGRGRNSGIPVAESHILGNRASVVLEELEFDADPFVLNNVLITNTTATTQIYTVGIALPTTFGAPSLVSGNIRTDVIDAGGVPGAIVSSVGGFPIYAAQIDFANVATLQNDPFTVVAPAGGSAGSVAAFGPNLNGIAVTNNIGIQLRFSLTAGDTAAILSRFDVVPVPEPSSLLLGAIGCIAVFAARWSRKPRD